MRRNCPMTNFRPKSLSPEALEAWDEAEANIQASMQRIRELTAPLRSNGTGPNKPDKPPKSKQSSES